MRSLILALAVAAMVVSSGCCLNDSSCNSCDGCPGGLAGGSGGCQLGNCRFLGGGGERLGLGIFEKGSECSSLEGGGCSSGGCSSGGCSSGGCSSGGCNSGSCSSGGCNSGECSSCKSNNVAGRVASNVRDRRATRRTATQRAATRNAATRNAVPRNAVARNSATAIPAPVGMVEGPIFVDGPKTSGCGLESCGLGGQGCGQGCGLGNRLPGNALAAGARTGSVRARQVGRDGGCGSASCGLGGPGCGGGCALRNHLPGALQNNPYGGQIPHSNPALGPQGGAGGLTPTYQYPYYTTRGPRDFLNGNPPSIGPR